MNKYSHILDGAIREYQKIRSETDMSDARDSVVYALRSLANDIDARRINPANGEEIEESVIE